MIADPLSKRVLHRRVSVPCRALRLEDDKKEQAPRARALASGASFELDNFRTFQ
jgi:hypothetical protein